MKFYLYYYIHLFLKSKWYRVFPLFIVFGLSLLFNWHSPAIFAEETQQLYLSDNIISLTYFSISIGLMLMLQHTHPVDMLPLMDLSTELAEALTPANTPMDVVSPPLVDIFEINSQNQLIINGQPAPEGTYYLNSDYVLATIQDTQSRHVDEMLQLRLFREKSTELGIRSIEDLQNTIEKISRYQGRIKEYQDTTRSLDNFIMSMVNAGKITQRDVDSYNRAVANLSAHNLTRR